MSDYIKREDAESLIIRNSTKYSMGETTPIIHRELFAEIHDLPSADVVEVVRCKDCKHRDAETMFCRGRGWPMSMVPDNGYCDKGRKEIA